MQASGRFTCDKGGHWLPGPGSLWLYGWPAKIAAAVHEASHHPALDTANLDDLLAPIIEEYRARSEYKCITIRYVPTRLTITTHVPHFQRIVRNLLSNAIRYTDRGMSEEQVRQAFDAQRSKREPLP